MVATAQNLDSVKFLLGEQDPAEMKIDWDDLPKIEQVRVVEGILDRIRDSEHWVSAPRFKPVLQLVSERIHRPMVELTQYDAEVESTRHCLVLMGLPTIRAREGAATVEYLRRIMIDRKGRLIIFELKSGDTGYVQITPLAWGVRLLSSSGMIALVRSHGLELIGAIDDALEEAQDHWEEKLDRVKALRAGVQTFYSRLQC